MKEDNEKHGDKKEKGTEYFNLREVWTYYFRKKDPNRPLDTNLKMMHGINKISIIMFLVAIVVIVVRLISRSF